MTPAHLVYKIASRLAVLTKENNGMVAGNQNDVVKHVVYNRKAILLVFTSVSNYCSSL